MVLLADAEKRSRALDPAGSFHLTAPAGSGKTFLLAARFLRLLGLVDHPQQILALTFTNKAAAEMHERVRGCLERAKKGSAPENPAEAELLDYASKALAAHKKLEELLLAGEILHIRTFHSFCYAIASQAPLEAGIAPGSRLMDENEQEFFLHDTVNEALQEIASRNEGDSARRALMNRLLCLNNSWWSLANEMKDLVKMREGLVDLVQVLSRDRASGYLAARVRELAETELKRLKADFEACELGRGWTGFLEQTGDAGAQAACTLPAEIPGPEVGSSFAVDLPRRHFPHQRWRREEATRPKSRVLQRICQNQVGLRHSKYPSRNRPEAPSDPPASCTRCAGNRSRYALGPGRSIAFRARNL